MKHSRLFLSIAVALLIAGCGGQPASEQAAGPALPPAKVRLATVGTEHLFFPTACTGTVCAVRRAQLAAKVMGVIAAMPVTLGQRVQAGDLLVKISADEIAARVAQAEAQLSAARRDLDRERALLTKGASTADTVKSLVDRFAGAQAMVGEASAMLACTEIRAPFDGVIARKFADVGDLASPGLPLLALEDAAQFQVETALPDSLAAKLAPGAILTVEIPSENLVLKGPLAELSSAADPAAHTVAAKILLSAGTAVRSGEFARVQLDGAPVAALMAPASAVTLDGQMQRVFVDGPDHRAILRLVRTGAVRGDRIEILSGLDDGEHVVLDPPAGLREGQPLEAARE